MPEKPKLRGVSHQHAAVVALLAGALLVAYAPSGRATWASLVYVFGLVALLTISAVYHRPMWPAELRARLRRLDHAAIFLLICGTYTPICLLGLPEALGNRMLILAWALGTLGIARVLFWGAAPRWVSASLYVGLGWLVAFQWSEIVAGLGLESAALIIIGGLIYSFGALIYAVKRPNPFPRVFGYHEVFHACVIAAAGLHFVAVGRLVLAERITGLAASS